MASAVLQTAFLGDMILTTPLLTRLAARGPVHVVATPANAPILANHPAVTSVIVFDKRGADAGFGGVQRVARALREAGATTAYLAQGSLRTAAIARLAGISERIAFSTSPGRLLATRVVPFDRTIHHAQRLWQLASARNDTDAVPMLRPTLHPSDTDRAQIDALFAERGVGVDEPLLALAPGSVWATKRWPSFEALAGRIADDPLLTDHRVVVLGAANDAPLAKAILSIMQRGEHPMPIDATGRLSLLASAALLGRVRVLVTNDSAPLHLASAMNTPTIALFGPTIPAFGFGPLATRQVVLEQEELACRPCHAHGPQQCPLTHWRCMRDLTAARVLAHVRQFAETA